MRKRFIFISSLIAVIFLYLIEQQFVVSYAVKTSAKILLFTLIPFVYIKYIKKISFKQALFQRGEEKNNYKVGTILGLIAFFIVLTAYFILKDFIDLQSISSEIQSKKITPANFILVGAYVTFGNSFLEEFFFRGFVFLSLYESDNKKTAYFYSSILFALYHIGIFKAWFNPTLMSLALLGLIAVGFIFCWLVTKSKNFINSWIVHILADSAIILIGLKMFSMI